MTGVHRVGDLEIDEDLPFQRRLWAIERVGWIGMVLVALAALVGLFGRGPLSTATAGQVGEPVTATYARFARQQSPETLRVELGPGVARGGEVRLWLARDYVDAIRIERIEPEPDGVQADPDRLVYSFRVAASDRATSVVFHLEHRQVGRPSVRLGLVDGPSLAFTQFVYP